MYGNSSLQKEIYEEKPDTRNIKNFYIVCSSWCHIVKSLFEEMNLHCLIEYDALPPVFIILDLPPYRIKMDPMKCGYDLTRVKIGCTTYGFVDLNQNKTFNTRLLLANQKIYGENYIFTDTIFEALKEECIQNNLFVNKVPNGNFSDIAFSIDSFT